MSKYKLTLFTILLVILTAIIGVGCSPAPTATAYQPATVKKEVAKNPVKTDYKIGDIVKASNGATLQVVTDLKKSHGGEYDSIKPGQEYVMVKVTICNNGKETIAYNPYDFKMQNSQGQILDGTYASINTDTALDSGNLAAGGTVSGTLIYEEPKDDKALTLIYTGNIFNTDGIKFKLN